VGLKLAPGKYRLVQTEGRPDFLINEQNKRKVKMMTPSEEVVIELVDTTKQLAVLDLLECCGLPEAGLSDHWATTLVARAGGTIVGSAALEMYDTAALLRSVAVDQTRRGQGLGQQLTQAALTLAKQQGVTEIYLLTETAADFFPRFGFQPIPRAQVAPAVQHSVEFTTACPASALAMMASL
jgi:amino-acid N-acetyltransferase